MNRDRPDPDASLEGLSRRLSEVERRLAALEAAPSGVEPRAADLLTEPPPEEAARPGVAWPETAALIGRTLLILAGAFLLRAVTESGALPPAAGTALGLGYALAWLVMAARAGRPVTANFYGLATAMIAFPLVWEATIRFELWSVVPGAVALVAVSAVGLGVAAWRRLKVVAWVITLFAIATTLALAVATKALVLFVAPLLLLGLATLWLGYERDWPPLGWTVAAIADVAVLGLGLMVLSGRSEQVWQVVHPESVVTLQLALVLIYCGSLGARTLARRTDVSTAEIAQGTAALLVGLGGAVMVSLGTGFGRTILGTVSLVCAAGCYAAAFVFIDRQTGGRRNFIFYTTLGLVFILVALEALLSGGPLALTLAALALITSWLGAVRQRATLTLHGAVYAVVAMVASGLLALAVDTMVGSDVPGVGELRLPALIVTLVAAICTWLHVATHGRTWGGFSRAPKLAFLVVAIAGIDTVLVVLGARLLPVDAEGQVGPAALAALRTGVLAVTALLFGWIGRFPRLMEARWLVYPVLAAGGLKLLAQDVPVGSAATLVLSFALYGGALIVAPRLARR